MSTHYHWIESRYEGECANCEGDIDKGENVLYDSRERKVYCEECGDDIAPQKEG